MGISVGNNGVDKNSKTVIRNLTKELEYWFRYGCNVDREGLTEKFQQELLDRETLTRKVLEETENFELGTPKK